MTLPEGLRHHRAESEATRARIAVLTVSDSRTEATDRSGPRAVELCEAAGHMISARALLPNDETAVRERLAAWATEGSADMILCTGGTGLGARDRSVEAARPLMEKELPGFGELFRMLSYQEQIGTAAILTRALAGVAAKTLIVVLPGSTAAVELALTRILLPELPHLLRELRR